jgi:hypothetical protein
MGLVIKKKRKTKIAIIENGKFVCPDCEIEPVKIINKIDGCVSIFWYL